MQALTEKLTRMIEKAQRAGLAHTQQTLEGYLAHLFSSEQAMKARHQGYYMAMLDSFEKDLDNATLQTNMDLKLNQQLSETIHALKRSEELHDQLIDNIRKKGTRDEIVQFGQEEIALQAELNRGAQAMDLAELKERNRRKALLMKKYFDVKNLPELDNDGLAPKIFDAIKNFFGVYANPEHTEADLQKAYAPMFGMIVEFFFSMIGNLFKNLLGVNRAKEVDQVVDAGKAIVNGVMMKGFNDGQKAMAEMEAEKAKQKNQNNDVADAALAVGNKPLTLQLNSQNLPQFAPELPARNDAIAPSRNTI